MAAIKTTPAAWDPGLAPESPALAWPNGAQVAVWLAPQLQYALAGGGAADDYGHRAGWWRLMDLLDKLGLRATVFVDARDAQRGADILQACVERQWELGACVDETDASGDSLQPQELALACETLRALSGQSLAGWRAGAGPLDEASLEQLAGAGLSYATNIHCIDHPRQLSLRAGPLVEIPLCDAASDQRCLVEHGLTAARYVRLIADQFEQLHMEGATRPTVLGRRCIPR